MQLTGCGPNTPMLLNMGINDRMLQYKIITETLFVTKETKSTIGFLSMKVFVSYKGYVKVYSINSPSGFMAALKEFAEEIRVPEILVANPHPSQKSK